MIIEKRKKGKRRSLFSARNSSYVRVTGWHHPRGQVGKWLGQPRSCAAVPSPRCRFVAARLCP